jgi:ethanolamine ammonia-lyase small subunit
MNDGSEQRTWLALRQFTQARIGLGRAGDSLPTKAVLDFGLAHAQARDAVHMQLDDLDLQRQLSAAGFASVSVDSAIADRWQYLRRPDMGRQLSDVSRSTLTARISSLAAEIVLVVADGLSALAVMRHAVPMLDALRARLAAYRIAPIVVAHQARVALGDEIGELWRAEQVIVLIGERPGLSSPDSLGAYLTYAPRVGRTDAERNCVSNIRHEGLSYTQAARRLADLMAAAQRLRTSGVALKDESETPRLESAVRVEERGPQSQDA